MKEKSLKSILGRNSHLTIKDLQELQETYDKRFISSRFSGFRMVEHTYAHIGKLMGRLATYIEAYQEGEKPSPEDIKNKIIPDLLVYSAWLAEIFGVDIEQAYLTRILGNIKRLYSDQVLPQELKDLESEVNKKIE